VVERSSLFCSAVINEAKKNLFWRRNQFRRQSEDLVHLSDDILIVCQVYLVTIRLKLVLLLLLEANKQEGLSPASPSIRV